MSLKHCRLQFGLSIIVGMLHFVSQHLVVSSEKDLCSEGIIRGAGGAGKYG